MTVEIIVRAPACPVMVTQTTEFRQPFGTGEQYTKTEIATRVDQGGEQTFCVLPNMSIRFDPLPPEPVTLPLDELGWLTPVGGVPPMPADLTPEAYREAMAPDHHPLSGGELDTSGERRTPTHYCKECGAEWIFFGDDPITGGWSLYSPTCGECCDNMPMGNQILPIVPLVEPLDDMQRAGQDYDGEEIDPDLRAT